MQKIGERYAAARRSVVRDATLAPLPARLAEPPVSEEAIRKGTGRGWDDWFRILDGWDGTSHTHTEIARSVVTVTHVKLADAADVAAHRADWRQRLGRLAALATPKPVTRRRSRAS